MSDISSTTSVSNASFVQPPPPPAPAPTPAPVSQSAPAPVAPPAPPAGPYAPTYFTACVAAQKEGATGETLEICHRAMQLFSIPGYKLVGSTHTTSSVWRWGASGLVEAVLAPSTLAVHFFGEADDGE